MINNKKINIVITGANGFIGKNLLLALKENDYLNVHKIVKNSKNNYIKKILQKSEFIFHLAGENRTKNKYFFKKNNEEFTKKICNFLFKNNIKSTIVFASSTQVSLNNNYGQSKNKTEKIILKHQKRNMSKVCILRLTNVFGKLSNRIILFAEQYNSIKLDGKLSSDLIKLLLDINSIKLDGKLSIDSIELLLHINFFNVFGK